MRREIALHKPPTGPFDIKRGAGGLIDLEFAIQTLQLKTAVGLHPRLEAAIADLAAAGLVPEDVNAALCLLTSTLVMFRLVAPQSEEPPEATRPLVAAACNYPDWQSLLAAHDAARQRVSALWRTVAEGGEG